MTQGEMFSDLAIEQQYDNMIKELGMEQETLAILGIIGFIVICAVAFKVIKHIVIAIKRTFKSE